MLDPYPRVSPTQLRKLFLIYYNIKMWTIVCFESDNSVDVVPDFWYNDGSCSWPKKNLNVKKFINRRISPNEIEFDNYSARALSKNIASFSEARTKILRAQETSELSSNDDDKNTRKTRRKICWSPSDDESSSLKKSKLPTPPNLIQIDDDLNLEDIEVYDLDMNKSISIQTQEIFSQNSSSNHSELNANYYDSTIKINKSAQSTPQILHTSQVLHETPQNTDSYLSTIDISDIKNELKDFKQIVNRNQVTIKYEIKNIQERLDLILNMQEKILDKLINNQTIIDYTECNYEEFLIPMESDEELEQLEDKIKTNLAYRKSVVTELSRLMGQNLSETVRKIMQKLFSDNLLSFYSYIGFKGKKQFSTLQTCAVIFESIRRMKKFTDITNIEIEKPLKTWMAQASARLKKIEEKKSL